MKKIQLEIPILLPEIQDEKDQCIERLVEAINNEKGIEKTHIQKGNPNQICIHYQPEVISLKKVKQIAQQNGATLTHRYEHLLLNVKGIRHTRHARDIEQSLMKVKGIIRASASLSGTIHLEWDTHQINQNNVLAAINKLGLTSTKTISGKLKSEETNHEHDHEHSESYLTFLGENTELYFAIGSGIFWVLGLVFSFIENVPNHLAMYLFICASITVSYTHLTLPTIYSV